MIWNIAHVVRNKRAQRTGDKKKINRYDCLLNLIFHIRLAHKFVIKSIIIKKTGDTQKILAKRSWNLR